MQVREGYKKTEVGVIPEDWGVKKFGELAVIDPDNLTSSTAPDYSFKYVALEDIDNGILRNITELIFKNAPSRARRKIKNGDILLSTVRPNLKSHFWVKEEVKDWICSTGFSVVRCKENITHPGFIFSHLFSFIIGKQIDSLITGSNYPAINSNDVKSLQVPIPPTLSEQTTIATALSDTDALINSMEQLITKKRAIKQGAMQELLTGKRRLPGFSGEWEVVKLADVADKNIQWSITGGPFGSNLKTSDYVSDGVRIIQLQNIGDGVFHNDYSIYTTDKKANELISCNIYPGEIILSKMGDPVARACLIPNSDKRYLMASDGIRLVVDKRRFDKRFVHGYINSVYFRKKAIEASTGSTRQRIGLSDLKKLPFIAPPLSEQTAIAEILSDIDSEIKTLEQKLNKYRQIKHGMMQELLTGRTRLI